MRYRRKPGWIDEKQKTLKSFFSFEGQLVNRCLLITRVVEIVLATYCLTLIICRLIEISRDKRMTSGGGEKETNVSAMRIRSLLRPTFNKAANPNVDSYECWSAEQFTIWFLKAIPKNGHRCDAMVVSMENGHKSPFPSAIVTSNPPLNVVSWDLTVFSLP